jgi:ribosome-associated translation inhibitor RaiA
MIIEYTGRQIRRHAKIQGPGPGGVEGIEKIVSGATSAKVILTVDKYRKIADVTVKQGSQSMVATCESAEMMTALRDALAKIEQQAVRQRQKATKGFGVLGRWRKRAASLHRSRPRPARKPNWSFAPDARIPPCPEEYGEDGKASRPSTASHGEHSELVIVTGMSGSGKLSALKAFEDLGYYSVDNLPLELIPRFADLVRQSVEIERAALVVDVREGIRLDRFPSILKKVRKVLPTRVVFLEASEDALVRRFSETRRPHPMGRTPDGGAGHTRGTQAAGPGPQRRGHRARHHQVQRA